MVSPGFPIGCEAEIGTMIIYKWSLTIPLVLMTMVDMTVERKMEESFERTSANLEMYSGAKILKATETLDGINVGLELQSKMLRI